jgi:hypothetical protein
MHWNGGSVFTFALDGVPTVVDVTSSAPFQSILAPGDYWLGFEMFADNANSDSALTATATYDNVATSSDNNSATAFAAYDSFSGPLIDLTYWDEGEEIRKQENGAFRLEKRGGSNTVLRAVPGRGIWASAVDMTVTATDDPSNVTALNFQTYNAADGLVIPGIGLTGTNARFVLLKCSNNVCTVLQNTNVAPVTLGSTHTLFLQWDGTLVTYQLDRNPPVQVDPVPLAGAIVSYNPDGTPKVDMFHLAGGTVDNLTGKMSVLVDNFRGGPAIVMP